MSFLLRTLSVYARGSDQFNIPVSLDQFIVLHDMLKYHVKKIGQGQLHLKERLHL